MVACTKEENWVVYVVVSLISLVAGITVLLPMRLWWRNLGDKRQSLQARHRTTQGQLSRLRSCASFVLTGNTTFSKIVMIMFWLVDIVAIGVYVAEAVRVDLDNNVCGEVTSDPLHLVWVGAMCVGLVRFIIKFFASSDKLLMWVDLYSLVDHLTIGPTFVGVYYNRNWLGLRFLRVVCLLNTADILQMIHVLKSSNPIRVVKALTTVVIVWTFGAGMFHLLENTGDPFYNYEGGQQLPFGDCIYFVLITLTTIGYGDISPKTFLGKAFAIVFVVLALATFTNLIPELGNVLASRNKYRKQYKRTFGKSHLVICGGITFETLTTVVKNFIHEDSSLKKTDLVIIDVNKPSSELQAFFRRHFNDVTFIQGTVLDIPTLKLARTQQADAVLILANRRAEDQDEEDAANIMRATAVKNLSQDIRIILQLLQHHNKEQLLHIPGWNWHQVSGDSKPHDDDDDAAIVGDEVICISELKMGFMAQNCLAPGIVTMLSNLICMRSFKPSTKKTWLDDYDYGAGHEIYAGSFSSAFNGLTFTDAAKVCLSEYGVLLVAVNCPEGPSGAKLRVNPGNRLRLSSGHVGFFIAQGPNEVERIASHRVTVPALMTQTSVTSSTKLTDQTDDDELLELISSDSGESPTERTTAIGLLTELSMTDGDDNNNEQDLFDSTNLFHWCQTRSLETATLNQSSAKTHNFNGHVIFVVCAGSTCSQEIGLVNFIKPLRASSIVTRQLQDIILYADLSFIEAEWSSIENYPKVYVYDRSRSINADLRSLAVQRCAMCLVMAAGDISRVDDTLIDKYSILTTKNILSLRSIEDKVAKIGVLANPDKFRRHMTVSGEIPMLIELEHDASVAYIDDDDDDDPTVPLFQTLPYACGRVLLASVLDSLVSAAYLNKDILTLIRALLTGGETNEYEKVLAEGVGIVRRGRSLAARRRSSLALLNLSDSLLQRLEHNMIYGEMVTRALSSYGLLCLGLYRLLDGDQKEPKSQKSYVITHPPSNFPLLATDRVYVLKPFEFDSGASITAPESDDDIPRKSPPEVVISVDSETPF